MIGNHESSRSTCHDTTRCHRNQRESGYNAGIIRSNAYCDNPKKEKLIRKLTSEMLPNIL